MATLSIMDKRRVDKRAGASAPRRRDAERTRAAILGAATTEFARHGFSGARTERITAAAACNIRLLYHHFGSKEGLYLAVLEQAYDDLRAREAELRLDTADPLGAVEALMRFTFAYFEANPEFEALLRAENMMEGRFVRQLARVPQAAARLREELARVIAAGEARGIFAPGIDPVTLYLTIAALSRFHLGSTHSLSALFGLDLGSPGWRAGWLEHCVALLRGWLRSGALPGR